MALKARARRTASTGSSPPYGGGLVQLGRGHAPDRQRGRFHQGQHAAGTAGMLSDQEAWDVAYFMNAHERPQDPRYAESVAATRAKYHDSDDSLYGIGSTAICWAAIPRARRQAVAGGQALNRWRGAAAGFALPRRDLLFLRSRHHTLVIYSCTPIPETSSWSSRPAARKSSLVRALLQQDPSILLSVSCTTRAPRPGEDGREYRFVAVDDFKRMRDDQALLEWAEVHGNFYGTPATASTPPPAKDAMCCSRSTGRARARSSSAFRAPSAFSSCRRRSRNSKPGSRRAARTSRKSSRAGSWRRAVKSRTLRNANMLLLIKNLA